MLSANEFIQQFESATLAAEHFSHEGHIRLVWLYLQQYDLLTTQQKVCSGIANYAAALGVTDKFNEELTLDFVNMIAERCLPRQDFLQFLQDNPDLVRDGKFAVEEYRAILANA